jgi:hypothetical protein
MPDRPAAAPQNAAHAAATDLDTTINPSKKEKKRMFRRTAAMMHAIRSGYGDGGESWQAKQRANRSIPLAAAIRTESS